MPIDQDEIKSFQDNLATKRARLAAIAKWHLEMYVGTDGLTELPYSADDTYIDCTVHDENDLKVINTEATLEVLKAVAKFASKVPGVEIEKDYSDSFTLKVSFPFNDRTIVIRYTSNREAVCTPKVVGTKVIPATTYPEQVVDVIEWECEKVSLLK